MKVIISPPQMTCFPFSPPASTPTPSVLFAISKSPNPLHALLFLDPNLPLDHFTLPPLLLSSSRLRCPRLGSQLHALSLKSSLRYNLYVQNSLIHMYFSFGDLNCALQVFDRMPHRDTVSWTSVIDGLVNCGLPSKALAMFHLMLNYGFAPNDATIVCVLKACGNVGAFRVGHGVHGLVAQSEFGLKRNVLTSLIDMYWKCGCLESAFKVFSGMQETNIFAWTSMISGLASHGRCKDAIGLFKCMIEQNMRPDDTTMTAVLSAYRNAGWVDEGYSFFNAMAVDYEIRPKIQHYGCMVDLLARAGSLDEAEEFVKSMPIEPDSIIWRTLVWACKVHGDINRGERLMRQQFHRMVVDDGGGYVLMENIYASAGKWHEKARVRGLMAQKRTGKLPGSSKIEVNGTIHEFIAGDSSHPEAKGIYEKWNEIEAKLKTEGYQPKLSEVLLDIEDEGKASQLRHHSEKLAVAYGLIHTSPNAKILVVKNLRSCEDCHTAIKFVSKIFQRVIVFRDRIRFHHFRDGVCSCGDSW